MNLLYFWVEDLTHFGEPVHTVSLQDVRHALHSVDLIFDALFLTFFHNDISDLKSLN